MRSQDPAVHDQYNCALHRGRYEARHKSHSDPSRCVSPRLHHNAGARTVLFCKFFQRATRACLQIPGGYLCASIGPTIVGTIQLAASAVLLGLIPAAGSLGGRCGAYAMSGLMLFMGLAQGPMSPINSQITRNWMPPGTQESAWAYRFYSLSHSASPLLASLLTPRLASKFGWRWVVYAYAAVSGAYTVLWQLGMEDTPTPRARKVLQPSAAVQKPESSQLAETAAVTDAKPSQPLFDWRIMRTKPVLALFAFHLAADFGEFTRHQLAPTMYMEQFGCTPVQMGSYLAIGNFCHVPAGFLWAFVEAKLISRNVDLLTIRRSLTCVASVAEAGFSVLYGLAPSPLLATVYYGLIDAFFTGHTGGGWANYLEVGAEDTATLNAVINSIASASAIFVPYLGFWLRAKTGSWFAQIMLSVVAKLVSGGIYARWSSTESARSILAKEDAAKQAATGALENSK